MRWTYDKEANALYIYLRDGASARQVETAAGLVADLDESGSVLGIEVVGPEEDWQLEAAFAELPALSRQDRNLLAFIAERWPAVDGFEFSKLFSPAASGAQRVLGGGLSVAL